MNISEKSAYVEKAISNISGHVDTDASVRLAKLDQLKAYIDEQKEAINAEIEAKIAAL